MDSNSLPPSNLSPAQRKAFNSHLNDLWDDYQDELSDLIIEAKTMVPNSLYFGDDRSSATTAKNVSPSQRIGKRVGLNRESGFLVIGRKHADQRTRNAKFGERQRTFLFLAHRFGSGCEGIFIKNGIGHNGLSCQILRTLRKPDNCSLCPILLLTFLQSFISVIFTPDCG